MCQKRNVFLLVNRYLFFRFGDFIYDYPRLWSLVTICICTAFCMFLPRTTFRSSFRDGFFLADSQSVEEQKAYMEFYNYTSMPYMMTLFGDCMDRSCSMLDPDYFLQMTREMRLGEEVVLPSNDFYERSLMLRNLLIYSTKAHFTMLEEFFLRPNRSLVTLQYPYMQVGNKRISLQQIVFGARNGCPYALRHLMEFNRTSPAVLAKIKYREVQWYELLKNRTNSKVNLYLLGDAVVDYEIQKASSTMHIYFAIGAVLMVGVLYRIIWQYEQGRRANIFLTFLTVFCPTLAGLSTFGIFALCRIPISSIMLLTPFLVLGVGVDNTFQLMHYWFYSPLLLADRFCLMYADVGLSITLSSATNVAAFLIGYLLSPSKDTALFCLCSAVAFAWCWVLQMFFFAPQMSVHASGKVPQNNSKGFHVSMRSFAGYSKNLGKFSCRHILAIVLMLLLYSICISSSLHMEENFAPEKTFDGDSFLAKSLASLNMIYSDHQMVQVLVTKMPGNVTVLLGDIAKIESSELLCDNFTTWIGLYDRMYKSSTTDVQKYFEHLPEFMELFPDTAINVIYKDKRTLVKLSFDLCLKGSDTWRQRALEVNDLRRTLPEGYSMFFYDSHIFDLILSAKGITLNALGITLATAMLICIFFLPSIRVVMCSYISLLSAMTMVIGGLYLWGADLDVVLMVNIIMAVGFTIGYISHISYNLLLQSERFGKFPADRMITALRAATGPTAQAAMTTVVCVLPLMFHKVYMYVIFAKTVVLCCIVGFLHAVFIMPFLVSLTEMIVPLRCGLGEVDGATRNRAVNPAKETPNRAKRGTVTMKITVNPAKKAVNTAEEAPIPLKVFRSRHRSEEQNRSNGLSSPIVMLIRTPRNNTGHPTGPKNVSKESETDAKV